MSTMETLVADLKTQKAQTRKDIRDLLRQVSSDQRTAWSDAITGRILDLPEYREAATVMVFLSFTTEYDTTGIMKEAFRQGKTVCAPRVDWSSWRIVPVQMRSADDIMTDEHKINEPAGNERVSVDTIDLVLVPGLAFDITGHRVGRGGGFYDRFLSRADLRAFRLAPTFDFQIRSSVPCDDHDQRVDMILSPTKTLRILR